MIDPALLRQVVDLSPDDRRELLDAVQDAVDPELAALIDEREAAARCASAGRPWEDFRTEIGDQYGH